MQRMPACAACLVCIATEGSAALHTACACLSGYAKSFFLSGIFPSPSFPSFLSAKKKNSSWENYDGQNSFNLQLYPSSFRDLADKSRPLSNSNTSTSVFTLICQVFHLLFLFHHSSSYQFISSFSLPDKISVKLYK